MATDRKAKKKRPVISVPVDAELNKQLKQVATTEERKLSDSCRRLWREALAAREAMTSGASAR